MSPQGTCLPAEYSKTQYDVRATCVWVQAWHMYAQGCEGCVLDAGHAHRYAYTLLCSHIAMFTHWYACTHRLLCHRSRR